MFKSNLTAIAEHVLTHTMFADEAFIDLRANRFDDSAPLMPRNRRERRPIPAFYHPQLS
jgi:hypothetical protein